MRGVGIDRGRDWLRVSAWGFALVLAACGGTTQQSGGANGGNTNHAGGGSGGSGGAGGGAGSAAGGGGMQGQGGNNTCAVRPEADKACAVDGQICTYAGSPCGPPGFKYTCTAGTWKLTYEGGSVGVCLPEACPGLNPATGCPYSAPMHGASCGGECLINSVCQYPEARAECIAGLWRLQSSSGGAAGASGVGNGEAGAPDEAAGGWGGAL